MKSIGANMEKDERNGMTAAAVAAKIVAVAQKKRSKPLVTVGAGYKLLVTMAKLLPCRIADYIVYLLYAR